MSKITFDVNNNGIMAIEQSKHDGNVTLAVASGVETLKVTEISAGDMVMLMNYYRYQKEHNEPIF